MRADQKRGIPHKDAPVPALNIDPYANMECTNSKRVRIPFIKAYMNRRRDIGFHSRERGYHPLDVLNNVRNVRVSDIDAAEQLEIPSQGVTHLMSNVNPLGDDSDI